jgi:ATP-dependent helicase Lhr and Lhr-like helicase
MPTLAPSSSPIPASAFSRYPDRLQSAIVARLGWSSLRPVQELASQAILDGANAIILAPTAGGKTEASLFPVLAQLITHEPQGVGAIYIAPIKALLNNQAQRLEMYTEMVGLSRFLWHGDIKPNQKKAFLRQPSSVLMTTPESLEVMLTSAGVDHHALFSDLRAVVIDEIHALAGSDRGAHLLSVLERIVAVSRHDVQRIGLSATVGNPAAILGWLQGCSQRPGQVVNPPPAASRKEIRIYWRESVAAMAQAASQVVLGRKSLLFCQSRAIAESMAAQLQHGGTDVFIHHSSVAFEERSLAESRFQTGQNTCIVCTSTLELGIDVGDLDDVLQVNAPTTVSAFLQRLGRTGRRGGSANTTFLVDSSATLLQAIAIVELARRRWVEPIEMTTRNWPVLVQQILAMAMQSKGISPAVAWTQLIRVTDFQGIQREEYDLLIRHLLAMGYLDYVDGLVVLGRQSEKEFGKKNFLALYAVFSQTQQYDICTSNGQNIGCLEAQFVDTLNPEVSCFLLGGRAWLTQRVDHEQHCIEVQPAPHGQRPSWGGFVPQSLSWQICQEMAQILKSDQEIPYLDSFAQQALTNSRDEYQQNFLTPLQWPTEQRATLWTYAGDKINRTIKYGLAHHWGWQVQANNLQIKISGEHLTPVSLTKAVAEITQPEFWQAPETLTFLQERLPGYRFSKFQQVLPKPYAGEVIQANLLDITGMLAAREYLLRLCQEY